jgi:hypothetical protein
MKKAFAKFTAVLALLSAACAAVQTAWNSTAPEIWRTPYGFWLLGMFAFTGLVVYGVLLRTVNGKPQQFVRSFMAGTVFKLLFYLLVLVALMLFAKHGRQALVLHFLFYYIVFTVAEVAMLYGLLNKPANN